MNLSDQMAAVEEHDDVERAVEASEYDGFMVIAEWIQESHVEGTVRIIDEAEYNGEIRTVSAFLDGIDGIEVRRRSKHGLRGYVWHCAPV